MTDLPTGTVTFLFTDIEGSTGLLQALGDRYPAVLDRHAGIVRRAVADGGGVEVSTHGDAFFAVFRGPAGAVGAAVAAQRGLAAHDWSPGRPVRVRVTLPSRSERAAPKERLTTERIVDTAMALMAEQGYEAVSMRSLARALDTGPASLYAHVANRDELDQLVIDRIARRL